MICDACDKCVVGNSYYLPNGRCDSCRISVESYGTYIGRESDNQHVFRLHPRQKCKCGANLWYFHSPCENFDGINVTQEFESLVNAWG